MKGQPQQRGATLVEAAVILLILLGFTFAIIEFGRVLNIYVTITNAAREGARFGVAPCQSGDTAQTSCTYDGHTFQSGGNPPDDAVVAYVTKYLTAAAIPVDTNTVVVQPYFDIMDGTANGTPFEVEYRYLRVEVHTNYDWFFFPFPRLPMQANAVMKNEIDIQR
jgi:Flp pilus assembly protein TadG